jgi:hypothetical protein
VVVEVAVKETGMPDDPVAGTVVVQVRVQGADTDMMPDCVQIWLSIRVVNVHV